jgi:hypothetical protein
MTVGNECVIAGPSPTSSLDPGCSGRLGSGLGHGAQSRDSTVTWGWAELPISIGILSFDRSMPRACELNYLRANPEH